jgi:hypothetical protein
MIRAAVFALVVLSAAPAALAHHGGGTFDSSKAVTLRGTLTRLDLINPHSWIYFDVTDENGRVTSHRCEMRSAHTLRRSGWTADMFTIGSRVVIEGSPDSRDPRSCYLNTVIFEDGRRADRYGQFTKGAPLAAAVKARAPRRPGGEPDISGDWAPEQLVMTDPRGRGGPLVPLSTAREPQPADDDNQRQYRTRDVELTEVGEQAAAIFDTYTDDNPRMRCETTSVLFDWTFDGPINRITQSEDTITLQYGQLGFTRTVHMNLAEHPADIEPSRAGHSIGRWEDDVLIVDTVGFAPGVLSPPILHGSGLHVIERFSLDPDTMALTRSYTAEDPVYFVGLYAGSDTIHPADLPYSPDACQELTFVDYSAESGQAAETTEAAAEDEPRPWWRFWD